MQHFYLCLSESLKTQNVQNSLNILDKNLVCSFIAMCKLNYANTCAS